MKLSLKLKILILPVFLFMGNVLLAQLTNEDCFMCHEDTELTTVRNGKTISLFVDKNIIGHSVHKNQKCISCHVDANVEELPHPEKLKPVNCGRCHTTIQNHYNLSIHGITFKSRVKNAPDCKICHGTHNVLSKTN